MCRHLAYLGPPIALHDLLYAPPHGLHTQAYAPREQRHGTVNADGFGAGWYPEPATAPVRYRRALPIWADTSFAEVATVTRATCVVAAVRDATPGFGVDEGSAQPFRGDGRLFSHNGAVADYETVAEKLGLPAPSGVPDARAPVDSAALFAAAVRRWRGGHGLADGLAAVVAAARDHSPGRYNLLAADGTTLAATARGDTLYTGPFGGGVVIASEPLDDAPTWSRVPEESLVTVTAEGVVTVPL